MENHHLLEIPGIILDCVQKNAKEELVLRIIYYNGQRLLDLRVWYLKDGKIKPSRKGLTLRPEVWQELLPCLLSESGITSNDQ